MMSDNKQQTNNPSPATPRVEVERRKEQDRRQTERQGKYDRRKNRCALCVHFKSTGGDNGRCLYHQTEMSASAFACPNFDLKK
ncbi:MAG: hypothetical protein K0Q50_1883 [Vampirovibrio sp.]|jgi:hypothetical protein|nr:hypothetical protein [Vampirovibrio sp.]